MTDEKKDILYNLLRNIGQNEDKLCEKMFLTGFLGMKGRNYNGELMVIGKAANGWIDGWLPKDVKNETKINEIVEQIIKASNNNPMDWVIKCWGHKIKEYNSYNAKTSAFWRVTHKVLVRLGIAEDNDEDKSWPSKLFWTNLYKISPYCGGNPDHSLKELQEEFCKKLLKIEIHEANPKKILMLTGLDWAKPFLDYLEIRNIDGKNEYIEAKGFFPEQADCVVVVAKHPQGKNEDEYVKEVVNAFRE